MLPQDIKLSELPGVYLLDKDRLPSCAAIYFVSDCKGQIIYIGRTVNLVERWREHHRFNQLKRLNRKNKISIYWITCSNDIKILSNLETEFINKYKPPLNWTKVVSPIRKITPSEIALQQSLHQLSKLNTMIFGFDPIAEEEPPTIYLVYPVLGRRGVSGTIRTILKNINKKASSLKWKEYDTEPKSSGKFGYWETNYNGIRIDLTPFNSLVSFMDSSTYRSIAGVRLMAFKNNELEALLENVPGLKENFTALAAIEEDPIPMTSIDKSLVEEGNNKSVVEIEPWEELEPMPEGEARRMNRQFLHVDGVEVEVCTNSNGKYFVRHNLYWWIMRGDKNPDPYRNCVIENLNHAANRLLTIKWAGYRFRLETIVFNEDDVEVESVLLPLLMFEDLLKNEIKPHDKLLEEIRNGEYKPKPDDERSIIIYAWLQKNSLISLLQTTSS
jgi:predicted GIY-YIG superfamily endonuclease